MNLTPEQRQALTLTQLLERIRRAANVYLPPENIMDLEELIRRWPSNPSTPEPR